MYRFFQMAKNFLKTDPAAFAVTGAATLITASYFKNGNKAFSNTNKSQEEQQNQTTENYTGGFTYGSQMIPGKK